MTYDKLGIAELPLQGTAFDELVWTEVGNAVSARVADGSGVSPTQLRNTAISERSASGRLLRVQTTTLVFDSQAIQEPVVRFTGICHHPYVENVTEGKHVLVRQDLDTGEELEVDMAAHTVHLDGEMVWGYTGRWFGVKPGDQIRAGAEGIGAGFSAEIEVFTVGGLITQHLMGVGASERKALGRPEISLAKAGGASLDRAGSGGRQGVGAGKAIATASGTARKKKGYS